MMRKKIILLSLLLTTLILSGCVQMFLPAKQEVTFTTDNDSTKIYHGDELLGQGKSVTAKIPRGGAQIKVKTPEYKDQYVLVKSVPYKHPIAYYPLIILDAPWCALFNYGVSDMYHKKGESYADEIEIKTEGQKLKKHEKKEKYIDLTSIKFNIRNYEDDITIVEADYSADNQVSMFEEADKKYKEAKDKKDELAKKKNAKKKNKKDFKIEDKSIKGDDVIYSQKLYETLKTTGYIDTVKQVFLDQNNTLMIQGSIEKVRFYLVRLSQNNKLVQCRTDIKWYLRNAYDEVYDSISVADYSGEFEAQYISEYEVKEMIGDAVLNSYLNILKNTAFNKLLPIDSIYNSNENLLVLNAPTDIVREAADAAIATVIVKRKDKGHGSGFAINNNGYVMTNYHVIASKNADKTEELKVVLKSGIELPAKVIRVNKKADIAILKVEYNFTKAFQVSDQKSFKLLNDVYTIGTPESIELGQSMSVGILSNERFVNNTSLLQLNMSVNSGNSGGPVFDKSGALHGVIKSKLVGKNVEGICFAVPAYYIPKYLNVVFK